MRASIGSARCELGLAVELVGDGGVVGHLAGVEGGGFGQDRVQADGRKSFIRAGFVGRGEEILLGDGEVVFCGKGALGVEIGIEGRHREGCDRERFHQRNHGFKAGVQGGRHGGDSRFQVQGKVIQLPRQHEEPPFFLSALMAEEVWSRLVFGEKYSGGGKAVFAGGFAIFWCFAVVKTW